MKHSLLLAAALCVSAPFAQAADVAGNWLWVAQGRNGAPDRESILHLDVQGDRLTGAISSPGTDGKPADITIRNGKRDGDNISFQVVRQANNNSITNNYSGKVAGDELVGAIEFTRNGETRSREWKAKSAGARSQAAAVPGLKPGYDEQGHKIVNETKYKELSADEADKYLKEHKDTVILDLRPAANYAAGHLPGAVSLDVSDDNTYKDALKPLDKNKRYLVHSVVGGYRTVRALEFFEANGFPHAVAINGGYQAWAAAGKPVQK